MSQKWKIALTTAATLAALAGGAAVYAQADRAQSGGSMMHGGSGGMMNMDMMGPMSRMMESCNKMMQDMRPSQGMDRHSPKASPDSSK